MMARYHGLSFVDELLLKARKERPDRRPAVEANASVTVTVTA